MSKPIYVFFCVQSFTEAYYQLSKEEKDNLWSKVLEGDKGNGVKEIISCNSRWADEGTVFWGVEEYPDMETYQKKVEVLEKLELYRYISSKSILGTKLEA